MLSFIVRRLGAAIPTLLILATATFFLLRLAPGGPFDSERAFPPEIQATIEAKYGLHLPLYQQFAQWLGGVLQGDLRESFQYQGQQVSELIAVSLPTSLSLGAWALLFCVAIGIPLGCIAAWKQYSWLDSSAMFLAVSGVSLPSYLVASILVLIF